MFVAYALHVTSFQIRTKYVLTAIIVLHFNLQQVIDVRMKVLHGINSKGRKINIILRMKSLF